MKNPVKICIISSVIAVALACGGFYLGLSLSHQKTRLDSEYYSRSEMIELDSVGYAKLVAEKKSFVVLVDKPGCTTTVSMRENMANFPDTLQFRYYRMMWDDVKESSLHDKVKFTPSVAIINHGEVKKWLQADRDEDSEFFNSGEALQRWISDNIEF